MDGGPVPVLFLVLVLDLYRFRHQGWRDVPASGPCCVQGLPPSAVPYTGSISCLAAYGYYEALSIRTEKITLQTTNFLIPGKTEDRQISDVHLGLM